MTFAEDATGKDLFTDALWSRRGGSVSALEFPAFTCGMPANSVVVQGGRDPLPIFYYSPLAAGLGAPSGAYPVPFPGRRVLTPTGESKIWTGTPHSRTAWESTSSTSASAGSGIDFDGDGTVDLQLCVQVNTNGDGITLTTDVRRRDPQRPLRRDRLDAGSQTRRQGLEPDAEPATLVNGVPVEVKSIREAFAAAPVANPDTTIGIRITSRSMSR